METRCVSTDDIYACTARSFRSNRSEIACPKTWPYHLCGAQSFRWEKYVFASKFFSAIWIIRTCVRWCARRRQIGLEVLKCSTSHMTSINAERSVHNNHISAIHASALIKCLIWLHIYYFLFIDIDKYARGALARTFHFPILFRIHRCCSLRHIDMCLFWLLSCFHDKSHNIFACIFNRMVDVKVYFPPLLSAEQKTNLVFRFTGLNLTLYTPGLSYILLHRVPNT